MSAFHWLLGSSSVLGRDSREESHITVMTFFCRYFTFRGKNHYIFSIILAKAEVHYMNDSYLYSIIIPSFHNFLHLKKTIKIKLYPVATQNFLKNCC